MDLNLPATPRKLDFFSRLFIFLGAFPLPRTLVFTAVISLIMWLGLLHSHPAPFMFQLVSTSIWVLCLIGTVRYSILNLLTVKLLIRGEVAAGVLTTIRSPGAEGQIKFFRWLNSRRKKSDQLSEKRIKGIVELQNPSPGAWHDYNVVFSAQDGKKYTATVGLPNTHGHLLKDDPEEAVLYLPKNPNKAVVFDSISLLPVVGPDGHFRPLSWSNMIYLILPLIVIIGNVVGCLLYFGVL